jgi:hypothetical protein
VTSDFASVSVRPVRRRPLHGVPDHLVRYGQLRGQVGGAVLQCLESRDRLAELLARFHVGNCAFGDGTGTAGTVGSDGKRHGPCQRREGRRRIGQNADGSRVLQGTSIMPRVPSHIGATVSSALAMLTITQASSAGARRNAASTAPRQRNVPETPAPERLRPRRSSVAGTAALTSPVASRGNHVWQIDSPPVSTMVYAADKLAT